MTLLETSGFKESLNAYKAKEQSRAQAELEAGEDQ
jgi:hypothetical protein